MTATLRVMADPRAVSMAEAIRRLATSAPLFLVTGRAMADLARELGSWGKAADYLRGLVEANDRPLAINVPTGAETSRTIFIAPASWTQERLTGWVGGHHAVLEAQLGEVASVGRFADIAMGGTG